LSWLEGCPCHEHIWLSENSYAKKQQLFFKETGLRECQFKGCRGSEMAAGAASEWLDKICSGTSPHLTSLLDGCSQEKRTAILAVQHELQEAFREELGAKFEMWFHLPYKALGICSSDASKGKMAATVCIHEWQSCKDKSKHHRVTFRIFNDPVIFAQIDKFRVSKHELVHYSRANNMLLMYAGVPLVERSIEGEHAKVEKAGSLLLSSLSRLFP
jgi:hypothetical protein